MPKQCVIYQLNAANTAIDDAYNVKIMDLAPDYTFFRSENGLPSISHPQGSINGGRSGSGQITGLVSSPVAPGEVVTLTFMLEVE
ncbi:hypothetical protein L0B53_01515 [Vibrio sp. SS-MA-C1-2]|uniref:hypothetical protein n=1 Tax=Vibrio sp. SS-MA-C1-2 TaxID=2908646 RepID=UPI001F35332A|nr:hypothetical protein [Vibrio sp. SS-MA-C1-2]UJF17474.1 hypothetical protein L0B53_01515 [Vibrio sp. SS-MA-C1-2]